MAQFAENSHSLRSGIPNAAHSAMAAAIAKFEPNAERKKWFLEVSTEYEDYRDDLIGVIELYLRGEGSAQRE